MVLLILIIIYYFKEENNKSFNIPKLYLIKKRWEKRFMQTNNSFELIGEVDDKELKIKQLETKLQDTEKKLNELNRNLELRVIERTVEVKKLLKHQIKFIDSLSHDLATPITPLVSLLPLLKNEIDKPETKKLLDTCIRNVEYLKTVINNARELVDITSSDLILKKENINQLINEIIKKYDIIFKTYNIKINNKIPDEYEIKTEKTRFLQLIDQIFSNSVNSMQQGGKITIEAKIVKKEQANFIQLSITDTGTGLTREQLDHLFDEFYKTDESRHKLDSTGLGLAICREIVKKHGGKIWADSHGENTGTTILFTLPSKDVIYTRSF